MSQATVSAGALDDLKREFLGEILTAGDAGYDSARTIFNGMIDRRPAIIARPSNTADVQRAVRFAREKGLVVSVKGGGHSPVGYAVCEDGLMIDLSLMKQIKVDPQSRVAIAEGGVLWGELDAATQEHGLAVTGGRVPTTGIAGLTLGSGSGWLERKLGYTVDNMIGAEMVTADGGVVRASADENPELFWGLRGGGGNFGIVTKFEYRLHKIGPTVFGGMLAYTRDRAEEVAHAYRAFMESAPDDVGGALILMTAPPLPFVPESLQGKPAVGIVAVYTGDPAEGEKAFQPLLELDPVVKMIMPMPYVMLQQLIEPANPPGLQNYWKADMYPELPDEAWDAVIAASADPPSPFTSVIMLPGGGAASRVDSDASAIGWRNAKWNMHLLGMWQDPAENEKQIAWVRKVADVAKPWAQSGAYLNFLMDEGEQAVRDSFGRNYQRMVALKNKYDPTNFFRLNQNIKPSTNGH